MKKSKKNIINDWLDKNGKELSEDSFENTFGCVVDVNRYDNDRDAP